MKKEVCVVTGSRAEYGLLRPLLFKLINDEKILLKLVVTGSHLSGVFGNTQKEIEADGFIINQKIKIPLNGGSKAEMAKSTGYAISAFADYFEKSRPDLLIVLGDRFEIFASAAAAAILGITTAHISGGDVTQGVLDDMFRHCITKMSFLHFAGCKQSYDRIIQLGENPKRVFNVGEPGVENCLSVPTMSISELQSYLNLDIMQKPYSIVTFHPVTLGTSSIKNQVYELIHALEKFPDMSFIITKANADAGGIEINKIWKKEVKVHPDWHLFSSLGTNRYISALKYTEMVIGNSSSGIVEAPAMKKPTVNIGNRQKGRMMSKSIINCKPEEQEIIKAIKCAMSPQFKQAADNAVNPYGDGNTSQRIFNIIKKYLIDGSFNTNKEFYDIEVVT